MTGNFRINAFDGRRKPMSPHVDILVRIRDGNQKEHSSVLRKGPTIMVVGLPFFDNFGDNYTVLLSADGHVDAGYTPVRLVRNAWRDVDLMLIPKDATLNFAQARWEVLRKKQPKLFKLFAAASSSQAAAKDRYSNLMEEQPLSLAALLNITTAMDSIDLPVGSPLDYVKELIWDEMTNDRFFAYADRNLLDQVLAAVDHGQFKPEVGSGLFHPGATRSFKQVQFGEANVQLTFHEGSSRSIDGVDCVKIEPDIDYFHDVGAHALLEVIPNTVFQGKTDPRKVYVLRWIAGRRAGVPEFTPPYVIV
jgi:hypothetical protein